MPKIAWGAIRTRLADRARQGRDRRREDDSSDRCDRHELRGGGPGAFHTGPRRGRPVGFVVRAVPHSRAGPGKTRVGKDGRSGAGQGRRGRQPARCRHVPGAVHPRRLRPQGPPRREQLHRGSARAVGAGLVGRGGTGAHGGGPVGGGGRRSLPAPGPGARAGQRHGHHFPGRPAGRPGGRHEPQGGAPAARTHTRDARRPPPAGPGPGGRRDRQRSGGGHGQARRPPGPGQDGPRCPPGVPRPARDHGPRRPPGGHLPQGVDGQALQRPFAPTARLF